MNNFPKPGCVQSFQAASLPALFALCIAAAGCTPQATAPRAERDTPTTRPAQNVELNSIRFEDRTSQSQVSSLYLNGYKAGENAIVESLGGGVGLLDYDMDGAPDLLFPTGGSITNEPAIRGAPNKLFRQLGALSFVEVSDKSRVNLANHYTHGCAVADADSDGFPDVLITGYGGLQFYRNLGDGTLVECAQQIGLLDDQWSSSAAWGDFNQDGQLDLYVAHYVNWSWQNHPKCHVYSAEVYDICSPHQFEGLTDCIFLGTPDGRFEKHSSEAGLVAGGKGLGVIVADVDLDGDVDIYVANDTENNFFYLNDGAAQLVEAGLSSGLATDANGVPNGSMGLALLDFKNDLQPDLWVTNYENETFGLYENIDQANFKSVSEIAGVTALGTLFVGFGTVASDFDLDGDEDLAVANGHVVNFPKSGTPGQLQVVLVNTGRRFERAAFAPESYLAQPHWGRGVVAGDLDGDGLLDLVFSNSNELAGVLRNQSQTDNRNWLKLRMIGTRSNRDAIGARVIVKAAGKSQLRCVIGGGSYLSQNLYSLHWGLGTADVVQEVTVVWPSGARQTLQGLAVNQEHTIIEPLPATDSVD